MRYADLTVRVWNVSTAQVMFSLAQRPSPMTASTARYGFDLAFRSDGEQLAAGVAGDGFTLHGIPDGEERGRWVSELTPSILRFSPDGGQIAVVGRNLPQVQILAAAPLTVRHTVALKSVPICVAWNPKGDQLAVGTRASRIDFISAASGSVRLCDARTGSTLQTLVGSAPGDLMTAQSEPGDAALLVGSVGHGLRRIAIVIGPNDEPIFGLERLLDPEPGFSLEGVAADGRVLLISEEKEAAKLFDPADPAKGTVRWPVAKSSARPSARMTGRCSPRQESRCRARPP